MSDEFPNMKNKASIADAIFDEIKAKPTGSLNVYAVEVWNEAIEAAALEADNIAGAMAKDAIRRLKK